MICLQFPFVATRILTTDCFLCIHLVSHWFHMSIPFQFERFPFQFHLYRLYSFKTLLVFGCGECFNLNERKGTYGNDMHGKEQ